MIVGGVMTVACLTLERDECTQPGGKVPHDPTMATMHRSGTCEETLRPSWCRDITSPT